jgi:hypothetical protein
MGDTASRLFGRELRHVEIGHERTARIRSVTVQCRLKTASGPKMTINGRLEGMGNTLYPPGSV